MGSRLSPVIMVRKKKFNHMMMGGSQEINIHHQSAITFGTTEPDVSFNNYFTKFPLCPL